MELLNFLIVVAILFVLALVCRSSNRGINDLRGWSYAHRGLHGSGVPENSMAAFKLALENGYGIELDVHLLKDGSLAVIHDSNLKRTTGREGRVEDLTAADLKNYRLEGTDETIPEFSQVLELFAGRAPMIIELKAEGGNQEALAETVCRAMEGYQGVYCMESFDPRCLMWLTKNRPQIVRGQLSQNFTRETSGLSVPLQWVMTLLLTNFLTRPDFIAYKFADRNGIGPKLCRTVWHAQGVSWTLRSREDYDTAVAEGNIPIFEGFRP